MANPGIQNTPHSHHKGVSTSGRYDWLCVAYAFAPINRSGTHRTLGFVRNLDKLGWDATVLTVDPRGEALDQELTRQVPDSTTVIRTPWVNIIERIKQLCGLRSPAKGLVGKAAGVTSGAPDSERLAGHFNDATHGGWAHLSEYRWFRDWITRFLMTPDSRVGWIIPAVCRGRQAIRRQRPRVIYSTSPYMSAHIIALILSKLTRLPWVADFRDPWRGNPFRELGYPSLDIWDSLLERAVISSASHVICNTPTMRDSLCQRLSLAAGKCSTILNAFDAEHFEGLVPKRAAPPDHFVLAHCGEFYGPRSPHAWLGGLRRALEQSPDLADRIHVLLLGSEYFNGRHLGDLARQAGVGRQVRVLGHRPRSETLSYMMGSDALMLAGPAGAGSELQVPNKLFEYLAVRRPIIAAVSPDSPVLAVLREARAEALVCEPNDEIALGDAIGKLARDNHPSVDRPWEGTAQFQRSRRAEELAAVFARLARVPVKLTTTRQERERFQHALHSSDSIPCRFTADTDPTRHITSVSTATTEAESSSAKPAARKSRSGQHPPLRSTAEKVSVIVTVLNDVEGLRTVLNSLKGQTKAPDEIVVVDGGSCEPQLSRMRKLTLSCPNARWHAGKPCNIAEGRNRAIRFAENDIIACIDSGCRAHLDWIEKLTGPFADPAVQVVGGAYINEGKCFLERLVGVMTMPGATKPVDPIRFNPSARSMSFRRDVWERAGGFPNWLHTAEDTLFGLKLRSLDPPVVYMFADQARVSWRPGSTPRRVFKQFADYARGEARIGRGHELHRYTTCRYLAVGVWVVASALCWKAFGPVAAVVAGLVALATIAKPHSRNVRLAADKMDSPAALLFGVLVGEWVTLAQWVGFRRGKRDRKLRPEIYVERLRAYVGTDSADVTWPGWSIKSAPIPHTLIVSWHWAPTNRASANVMSALFQNAPSEVLRVITRHLPTPARETQTPCPPVLTEYVDWPLPDDRPVRIWTWLADLVTTWKIIRRAKKMNRQWSVERVLAVFPHRFSLVAGYVIARWLGVPFVAYMHDLCSEALITKVWVKKALWRIIDRKVLGDAWMVIVPTEEFARHYKRRGVERTWVLPHCLPTDLGESEPPANSKELRFIYSGNVYKPHEDAIAAVIEAARDRKDVTVSFQSNPHSLLHDQNARWMSRREAMRNLHDADVFLVTLGSRTPYPQKIHGCFPSKITDYLAVGRPILAVVPEGCFVDRFVRRTRCGLVVNSIDPAAIRNAFDRLHDTRLRNSMAEAARYVARQIEPDYWFSMLMHRLVTGPSLDSSDPPFPVEEGDTDQPGIIPGLPSQEPLQEACVPDAESRVHI